MLLLDGGQARLQPLALRVVQRAGLVDHARLQRRHRAQRLRGGGEGSDSYKKYSYQRLKGKR
ncbi:hypothetical protein D3C81_2297030 [compost metagenome]